MMLQRLGETATMLLLVSALLATIATESLASSPDPVEFFTCPAGQEAALTGSEVTTTVTVNTLLDCARQCSKNPNTRCSSFNACQISTDGEDKFFQKIRHLTLSFKRI
jgi:hypothetical protein